MQALIKLQKEYMARIFLLGFFIASNSLAATDLEAQESFAKARSKNQQQAMDHSEHAGNPDKNQEFRGIFYGYLPCDDCDGIKTTLSLQQKNNYLMVIQPAREASREIYERGKYDWSDETRTVVLTPKKAGLAVRRFHIENAGTLIQLNDNGTKMDGYELQRSDTVESREVHIH